MARRHLQGRLPRTDLKVTLDGVNIKPSLALGGWLAFEKQSGEGMVMDDLVLTMEEANPVMSKLLAGGIIVTAVHNHLLRNRPFTMYMHVQGVGDPVKLAGVLHAALAESRTPFPAAGQPATARAVPPVLDLDTAALDRTLNAKDVNNGGIYQFSIPRAEAVTDMGMPVPPAMGQKKPQPGRDKQPCGSRRDSAEDVPQQRRVRVLKADRPQRQADVHGISRKPASAARAPAAARSLAPTQTAMPTTFGPGMNWHRLTMSRNSASPSQPRRSTAMRRVQTIPPPKSSNDTVRKAAASAVSGTRGGGCASSMAAGMVTHAHGGGAGPGRADGCAAHRQNHRVHGHAAAGR